MKRTARRREGQTSMQMDAIGGKRGKMSGKRNQSEAACWVLPLFFFFRLSSAQHIHVFKADCEHSWSLPLLLCLRLRLRLRVRLRLHLRSLQLHAWERRGQLLRPQVAIVQHVHVVVRLVLIVIGVEIERGNPHRVRVR